MSISQQHVARIIGTIEKSKIATIYKPELIEQVKSMKRLEDAVKEKLKRSE